MTCGPESAACSWPGRCIHHSGTTLNSALANGKYRQRDSAGWIPIPIAPIITPERAAQARAQLHSNRAVLVGRPARFFYLLRTLVVCDSCGYRYRGSPSSGRRRYRHDQDGKAGDCVQRFHFSADDLEALVKATITAALRDPAVLRRGVEAYELSRGATDVELKSRVAQLQKQIGKIRQDERRLIDLVVGDREQEDLVQARLHDLAKRRGALVEQLRVAEEKVAWHDGANRADSIERLCAQARKGLAKLTDEGWRKLLLEVVDEVRVKSDRTLEIRGLLPDANIEPHVSTGVQALMKVERDGAFKKA